MRKFIRAATIFMCVLMLMTGCSSGGIANRTASALSGTSGGAVVIEAVLDATITQGTENVPYTIHALGDGVMRKDDESDKVKEYWRYTVDFDSFGTAVSSAYDLASFAGTAVKGASGGDWILSETVSLSSGDCLFFGVVQNVLSNATVTEDNSEYICEGALDGEALQMIVEAAINADHAYDLSSMRWTGKNIPVTVRIDKATMLPLSLTADCGSIAELIAEKLSQRSGVRLNLNHFVLTVTYSDLGRIKDVTLPDIVVPGQGNLY